MAFPFPSFVKKITAVHAAGICRQEVNVVPQFIACCHEDVRNMNISLLGNVRPLKSSYGLCMLYDRSEDILMKRLKSFFK